MNISLEEKTLELKFTWKIARNASDFKRNFIIKISDGIFEAMGEAAPNVRYGESAELIIGQFQQLQNAGLSLIQDVQMLHSLFQKITTCNSLRFGIESAFINYWSKNKVEEYLGIPATNSIYTAFTMPIMPIEEMCDFYKKYDLQRFKYVKLKINADNGVDALKEISKVSKQEIMIDGNEAFQNPDEVLKYIEFIKKYPVAFLEQPMPSSKVEEYKQLKPKSSVLLIGDESITDNPDMDSIAQQFHGVNMKLQKAGGYINGLRIINEARKRNLKTMVGCMVETSVGIGSAMHICSNIDFIDLDGFLILKEEPFQQIEEKNGALFFK
jgi:L-alanine-DL-glutamate epimerase-like enolase superfamily enzyme